MRINIDRGIRSKLRGHWKGSLVPIKDPKIGTIQDLSLILKIKICSRSISGPCSFHIGIVEHCLSVKGLLMGNNSMSLEATRTSNKNPAFNLTLQIVAVLESPTLITGKVLIFGGALNSTVTVAELFLEKQ
jgi:hypothetical protein